MQRAIALAMTCLAAAACQTAQVRGAGTEVARALVPVSEEKQLGAQMSAEIESKTRPLNNPAVVDYVRAVGNRVASASANPDHWTFTFKVLDDPKTVNAFAIPGGTLYVYTGLLKAAQNEAQLAGVMAHEVAHVTSRHMAQRMVAQLGLETVLGLALGRDPNRLAQIASSVAAQGALLKNSRDEEAEADSKGVVACARAGYDPHALPAFFQILKGQEGASPGVLTFLSDHPATEDRIQALDAEIASRHLAGDRIEAQAYAAMKQKL